MRIDTSGGSQRLVRLSQDQIELVNSNLVTATGALNTKIDTLPTKFKIRHFNAVNLARFSTTSTSAVFVTGSNTTYSKKFSDTQLRVNVFISVSSDASPVDSSFGVVTYSINGGSTWQAGETLRGTNTLTSNDMLVYVLQFNLGVLSSGTIDFRTGIYKILGSTIFVNSISYVFIEALENA